MARGNLVSIDRVRKIAGLYVLTSLHGEFTDYNKMYVSKSGTVIGHWGDFFGKITYRDYLRKVPQTCKIVKIEKNYIVLNEE